MLDPPHGTSPIAPFFRRPASAFGRPVCRLGLACAAAPGSRPDDVHHALERGVNFLNWPGTEDRARAGRSPSSGRGASGWSSASSSRPAPPPTPPSELRSMLATLGTDYIDVLTFYYVEEPAEWAELIGPGGALDTAGRPGATGWSAGSA